MSKPSARRGTRLAHIGIAVSSLDESLPFYRDILGLPEVPLDDADGASIVGLAAGDSLVELLEAASPESPIGRFVAKRGPGIHHSRSWLWIPGSPLRGAPECRRNAV